MAIRRGGGAPRGNRNAAGPHKGTPKTYEQWRSHVSSFPKKGGAIGASLYGASNSVKGYLLGGGSGAVAGGLAGVVVGGLIGHGMGTFIRNANFNRIPNRAAYNRFVETNK